ncbi:unnamed protein product, partial [Laminaria digitata]
EQPRVALTVSLRGSLCAAQNCEKSCTSLFLLAARLRSWPLSLSLSLSQSKTLTSRLLQQQQAADVLGLCPTSAGGWRVLDCLHSLLLHVAAVALGRRFCCAPVGMEMGCVLECRLDLTRGD